LSNLSGIAGRHSPALPVQCPARVISHNRASGNVLSPDTLIIYRGFVPVAFLLKGERA
jgi:hypothetical protein